MFKKILLFTLGLSSVLLSRAQFPYNESFTDSIVPGLVIGGSARLTAAAGIDPAGQGFLRLTDAINNQVGYAYSQNAFPSNYGITASFEFFTYKTIATNQADGFTFFLYDAGINSFRPGAFGGALGYAQRNSAGVIIPGLGKGYIGIGVDEYGNFPNNIEGKNGPTSNRIPNSVVVRGPGNGTDPNIDYLYKASASCDSFPHTTSFLGFTQRYTDSADIHYRKVKFLLTPGSSLSDSTGYTITVILYKGSGITNMPTISDTLINHYDYPYIAPPLLKFGLAGSTGGSTDVHEIRNVRISPTNIQKLTAPTLLNDSIIITCQGQSAILSSIENDRSANYGGVLDKATVDLDPSVEGQQTTYIDAGKGIYSVDATTGLITFTPLPQFSGLSEILYHAKDNYGIESTVPGTIKITVYPNPSPVLTISNPPAVCAPVTIDITNDSWKTETSPGATYTYYKTVSDANAGTNSIDTGINSVSTTGTYFVKAMLNSCPTVRPITAQIFQKPTVANAGYDQFFCIVTGTTLNTTLVANNPEIGIGEWSQVSGPSTALIVLPHSSSSPLQNLTQGDYAFKWSIRSGPCDSSIAIVKVIISFIPTTANAGTSRTLCNAKTDTLTGNVPLIGTGAWTQTAGPLVAIDSANKPVAFARNLVPGNIYTFKYVIANGICKSAASINDTNIVNTVANAGADKMISDIDHFKLNGNTPGTGNTGLWSFVSKPQGSGAIIDNPANPASNVTNVNKPGDYVLQWKISNGICSNTSKVTIHVNAVLPVKFISFSITQAAQANNLYWQVITDGNTHHFTVQRSSDGISFISLGDVTASNNIQQYTYADKITQQTATVLYYRIAEADNNGRITYSSTVTVTLLSNNNGTILMWPNPFSNSVNVQVIAEQAGKTTLTLYTATGKQIATKQIQVQQGINQLQFTNLQPLTAGMYVLRVQTKTGNYTQTIMKQ